MNTATTIEAPSPETLAEWRQLTDQNAHTEARLAMCAWFRGTFAARGLSTLRRGIQDIEDVLLAIHTIHVAEGHLTPELFELREKYTTAMIDAVRRVSPDMAAMIYNCL